MIVAVCIIIIIIKPYIISYDTVLAFTGGLGSGKSLLSTQYALKLLRKNRWKVRFHNIRHPRNKWEKPMLYSTIPFRISRREWANKLTPEHLLLQQRVNDRSVCFLDEIDAWANQFEYNSENILDGFNEFCRLYRHYTKGGYIVCNTQCTDNIVLQIRRRMNSVLNLMHFKKHFYFFYTVKIRNITLSEEFKTIEEGHAEESMSTKIGIIPRKPFFLQHYDTYCYSGRYETVPRREETKWERLKTNVLIRCPKLHKPPKTKTTD